MNALFMAWKLRTDLLTILAAATPKNQDVSSESRLILPSRVRRHRSRPEARSDLPALANSGADPQAAPSSEKRTREGCGG
jgi:hypothetical protein